MPWLKVDTLLRNHHKLIACADDLDLKPVYLKGHLVSLWLACLERFEDGDLSKLDDVQIAILAEFNTKFAGRFVQLLRKHRWIDDHLIHDWLDSAGDYLKAKYRRQPDTLLEIWKKHGREEDLQKLVHVRTRTVHVQDTYSTCQDPDQDQELELDRAASPPTLHPQTQSIKETKNSLPQPRVFSDFEDSSLRVQSFDELSAKSVYGAFGTLCIENGVSSHIELSRLAIACGVSPAAWVTLFLDKIGWAYGREAGAVRCEARDINPAALTVAGLRPRDGKPPQRPTQSAESLFREIFHSAATGSGRWAECVRGLAVAAELAKRKGKGRGGGAGAPPAKKRGVLWEFVCDVCGHAVVHRLFAGGRVPADQPCDSGGECQGTMRGRKIGEAEK